ncbi:hypothetical protein OC845_003148 [Tilletia horrida]|nr:hypothetical protein OC845_003148 [Tilletia horrida]
MRTSHLLPLLFAAVVHAGAAITERQRAHSGPISPEFDSTCKAEANKLCPVNHSNPMYTGDKWLKFYMKCLCDQWRGPAEEYTCQVGCYRDIFQGGSLETSHTVDALCDSFCNHKSDCGPVQAKCI